MIRFIARPPGRPRAPRRIWLTAALALGLVLSSVTSSARPLRIAFGDIPSIETLGLLIAFERARERGLEIHASYYESEDVAAQAVLSGGADIGVGAPYAAVDHRRPTIRLIFQLSRLHFIPVLDTEHHQSWSDLDGAEVAVHSRGSGTEAIARLLAEQHGIEYERIHYVAGSEVRAGAMLAGDIRATLVDTPGWNLLEQRGDRFRRVSMERLSATDEALYATQAFLEAHPGEVRTLIEEVLWTWRAIAAKPEMVARLRDHYDLVPGLPPEVEAEIVPFYADAVSADVHPTDGGSPETVQYDLEVYLPFGDDRNRSDHSIDKIWEFGPARAARERLDNR
ncbi:MAG: ABC transporter substrate-binding protein [Halofilum sp. (in: g-proteobacteria)]